MSDLRFIVTQQCNFNCFFCHREGVKIYEKEKLSAEDYVFIFETARILFGYKGVTITGGEPLLRSDIEEIIKDLRSRRAKITLVTNGSLLYQYISLGNFLAKIHISLFSLETKIWQEATKSVLYMQVIKGVKLFRKNYPKKIIKLNIVSVPNKNINEQNILKFLKFAQEFGVFLKFIPPVLDCNLPPNYITNKINSMLIGVGASLIKESNRKRFYSLKNIKIEIDSCICDKVRTTPDPKKFCQKHSDIFITPGGKLKPCMFDASTISILEEVKNRKDVSLGKKLWQAQQLLGDNCPLIYR